MITFDVIEKQRKKLKKLCILCIVINIIFVSSFLLAMYSPYFFQLPICTLAVSLLIYYKRHNELKKYKEMFNEYFTIPEMNNFFDNLTYDENKGIDEDVIRQTKMIWLWDRFYSTKYISGSYKNVHFFQSNILLEKIKGTEDRRYIKKFKAKWMIFEFNKEFKTNLHVAEKGFKNKRMGGLFSSDNFKTVKLEYNEFNRKFNVHCEREIEAFYILTPHMMENLLKIEKHINGKFIFGFIENKLHICYYPTKKEKNFYTIYTKINKEKVENQIKKEINLIVSIIDELKLNDNYFK